MSPVRHWHIGRLIAAWLAAPAAFLAVRWLLRQGIYEAHMEGHRVTIVSGLWSSGFASAVTTGFGVLCGVVLVALSVTWLAGRRERRRMASMRENPHRRPLM